MRGAVLLLAAGSGERLGSDVPKAFIEVGGMTLVRRAASNIAGAELVDLVVVAAPTADVHRARDEVADVVGVEVRSVVGGTTRQASAAAALAVVDDAQAVLVHDAARPLAPGPLFDACLRELDVCEAVCAAIPVTDTIKETADQSIVRTMDRTRLVAAQTPQGFRTEVYRRAHEEASRDGVVVTDDAALVERLGVAVRIIGGTLDNVKVTTRRDLDLLEELL